MLTYSVHWGHVTVHGVGAEIGVCAVSDRGAVTRWKVCSCAAMSKVFYYAPLQDRAVTNFKVRFFENFGNISVFLPDPVVM